MIKFSNFRKFLEYIQRQSRNITTLDITPLFQEYRYIIAILRPYEIKLNGIVFDLRYILSRTSDFTQSKDVILYQELPLYSGDYFYPENVVVAQVTGAITVDYIHEYGKHGIRISPEFYPTAVNQIEILNVMDY